jgi:hypothetical protein
MEMGKAAMTLVPESTVYENLVEVGQERNGNQPEKPKQEGSAYPFTLKVHCWSKEDTNLFAKTIGRSLSSNDKTFTYYPDSTKTDGILTFEELRENPYRKRKTNRTRPEAQLWTNTLSFLNDAWIPYFTFLVRFETEEDYVHFSRVVKQRLSLDRPYMSFPEKKPRKWKYKWVSTWDDHNPKYPVYIISKGRADSRLTSRCFERYGMPYYIAIEPQDYDEYACVIDLNSP